MPSAVLAGGRSSNAGAALHRERHCKASRPQEYQALWPTSFLQPSAANRRWRTRFVGCVISRDITADRPPPPPASRQRRGDLVSFSQRVGGDFFDDVSANRSSRVSKRQQRCWPMKEELTTSLDRCSAFDCFHCCKKEEFNSFFDAKQTSSVSREYSSP